MTKPLQRISETDFASKGWALVKQMNASEDSNEREMLRQQLAQLIEQNYKKAKP